MAIKVGKKLREESQKERVFKKNEEALVSVMQSGIKIRKGAANKIGFKVGDNVWFAYDSNANKLYLFKPSADSKSVSKLSSTLTFHNKGFEAHALVLAGLLTMDITGKDTEDEVIKFLDVEGKEFKAGDTIDLAISTTPTEGIYYELSFKEFIAAGEKADKKATLTETLTSPTNGAITQSEPSIEDEDAEEVEVEDTDEDL